MNREEFMQQFEGFLLPGTFDQDLLDQAAEMFEKWGKSAHMNEREHLFKTFGLVSKPGDSTEIKMQKIALRFVCSRMMEANFSRNDAADLMRNFNRIKDPGYHWIE